MMPPRLPARSARFTAWPALALHVALVLSGGCGAAEDARTTLTVYAASSLTEAFRALEHGFEQAHPEVDVALSFSGSQVLRLQIEQGAAVDVIASAHASHMAALREAGLVPRSQSFARNALVVIVPRHNPAEIRALDELSRASRLVIGAEQVPVGIYTRKLLDRVASHRGPELAAQLRRKVVSEESNARLVRAKVELGEADAAIVYRTDAVASEAVDVVPLPEALDVRADYHIAPLRRSPHPELARRWIAYVQSPAGRHILTSHGFSTERR